MREPSIFIRVIIAISVSASTLFHVHAAGDDIAIVADGTSPYVIVVAEDVDESKITEAANLLQMLVAEATGVTLPIHKESKAPDDKPAIYLGRTKAAKDAGIDVDAVTGWSYHNKVVGDNVFLVGQDIDGEPGHGGFSGYGGSLKAVTAFLESQADVRFVLPGRMGIHVPKLEKLAIDAKMDVAWSPLFQFVIGRRVSPWSGKRNYDPYAIANNYFGRYAGDTKVFKAFGSHSYPDFVPHEKYFETHPEYFHLRKGKRSHHGPRNLLCISNPEVHDIMLREMEKALDEGYQMVMLGQSDGYIQCSCPNCAAIHPVMSEKIWITHRYLAEEMKKRRPDKQIVMLSYVDAIKPPMTFDEFPDNVVILNNRYVPEYFEAWRRFDTPRVVYFPDWLSCWPRIAPRYAVNLIRLFLENNVIGIYLGGGLDSGVSPWGLNGCAYYAFGKAMGDPTLNADDLEREYVDASFGEAAKPMREFFKTMNRRLEVRELVDRRGTGIPDRNRRGYPFDTLPGDFLCHFFAPKILNDMSAALKRAKALVKDEKAKARLELVEAEFVMLRDSATMQHLFRAYQAAPSLDLLNALEAQVAKRRELLEWFRPNGKPREPGGRRQLRSPFGSGAPIKSTIFSEMPDSAPYNWDFEAIRASGELPNPDVNMKIRGGQTLSPYAPPAKRSKVDEAPAKSTTKTNGPPPPAATDAQEDDGFIEETINAPYDM